MIARDPEYRALLAASARLGADRLLVQAAGGNTSIKDWGMKAPDGVMWIKASGTWLADAEGKPIMVPVRHRRMVAALEAGDPAAGQPASFIATDLAEGSLRPSIETAMHAVIPARIVIHVHCVATIARAIRPDAETAIAPLLAGLDWRFVPYVRPGLELAEGIAAAGAAPVYVLGNHGLVVAAETVAEAVALQQEVSRRLAAPARPALAPDLRRLAALAAGTAYAPAEDATLHGAADPAVGYAAGRSLYPDHVIFLGRGVPIIAPGAPGAPGATLPPGDRPLVLAAGAGALLHRGASVSARAMAGCLADVLARLPANAPVNPLSAADEDRLLDWDAERYRQGVARA